MALSSARPATAPLDATATASRILLPALAVLFFLSGAAALVYQVLWLRLMGLVFGITVHAATTVLASFMSGLAIGSIVAGRLAPRLRRPLLWFAVAELFIGAAAFATRPAIGLITDAYVLLHPSLAASAWALTLGRFFAAWLVLLVPTALMGASLPLVLKSSLAGSQAIGTHFAALYASNTAGAIAGTLLVGFVLIERFGISVSFQLAVATNVVVAAGAFLLHRALAPVPAVPVESAAARRAEWSRDDRLILVVFAMSGFAALALEIVWFRLLVLFVPATTYAFSTMLAAVLFGIAAGSALAAPLLRRVRDPRRALAWVELGVGFAALLSMAALTETYRAGWRTSGTIQASLLTIAPACALMGLAFPLGVALITRSTAAYAGPSAGRVGTLYALNVGGAILGAAAAGFLLVPNMGIAGTLIAVAALHVAAGLLLLPGALRRRAIIAAAVVAVFVGTALVLPDPVASLIRRRYGGGERIWWREEGAQSTVSVHVRPAGGRHILYLDGLHQANDTAQMVRVHRQIGHLPMALHPDPREALVIGLGAGATAGAVSRHTGARVTIVELSPSVVRAARMFGHINERVVDASHVRVAIDDARNHLLVAGARYDVITADIIQPIHAGAGNLYSREYFSLVRQALKPGGLALQWIGHREATAYRLIMQTFLSVFPRATLWVDGSLMIGSVEPLVLRRAAFERKLTDPDTRAALEDIGLASFDALLATYTAGPDEMRALTGDSPILTDDRPRIEYFGSLPENDRGIDLRGVRGDVRRHVRP